MISDRPRHAGPAPLEGRADCANAPHARLIAVRWLLLLDEVAGIKDLLAFYPQKVDSIEVSRE